jgi:lipopolysaccharide export system permease protein
MTKTIDRYVLREVAGPFVVGLAIVTFALVVARMLKLIEMILNHGISLGEMMRLLGYIAPGFLELIFPMAVLVGVLLGFGRLSGDLEITAARACGISLSRMAAPVLVFALVIYAVSTSLAFVARPWANSRLRSELYEIARTRASVGLKEKVFNKNFSGLVVYAEHIDQLDTRLKGVMISDERNPAQPSTIIAKSGLLVPDEKQKFVTLRLLDGSIFGLDSHRNSTHVSSFGIYDVTIRPGEALGVYRHDPEEMGIGELRATIAEGRLHRKPDYVAETEMARKFTVPVASVWFALLGISLGLRPARGGQSERFGLSAALFFAYYILMKTGQSFAEVGRVNAYLAMSLPDLIFAIGGIWLFYRTATDVSDQSNGPGDLLWAIADRFSRKESG